MFAQQQALAMYIQAQQAAQQQLDGSNPSKMAHTMSNLGMPSWDQASLQMMMLQGQFPMFSPYMMTHPAFSSS
jgi:hypothetical protein